MNDDYASLGGLLLVVSVLLLMIAFRVRADRNNDKAAEEADKKLQVYRDAWSAAQESGNIDAIVRCGDDLVKATREWLPHRLPAVAWDVYQKLLPLLKAHPDLKPTVLEIGRYAYGARKQGALTLYDEQAIQNDIMAHLG